MKTDPICTCGTCLPCAKRALQAQELVREVEDRELAAELAKAAQTPPAAKVESVPLEVYVRVSYDVQGVLGALSLNILGLEVLTVYPEPSETEGDLFQRALDRARAVALCVRRVPVV